MVGAERRFGTLGHGSLLIVVPAKAGTHSHRPRRFRSTRDYGSPLSRGRQFHPSCHPCKRMANVMRFAMVPQALGYVGVRAKDLADWASYGSGLLGLQRIDKSRSTLAFRMDDRKQRLVVDQSDGEGVSVFGWEVTDRAALDALAGRLDNGGIKLAAGNRALANERHVSDLIVLNDPIGNRIEVFHGAETASEPFVPGRSISGFRTGALGLGHVVFGV